MRARAALVALAAAVVLPAWGRAQDTRTVTEPRLPPVCATLQAQLPLPLPATLETHTDQARIQAALDRCAPGQGVALAPGGAGVAFLSGPLTLPAGVALILRSGATLLAARDPRAYDVTPGSCGVIARSGHGCRPLIGVNHAAHAAVMGAGTIDGRGGANLLGQRVSWWMLARAAQREQRAQNVPRLIAADHADDFTLYQVRLRNAPNFHVLVENSTGFTAWGVIVDTPGTARNTDGIDILSTSEVSIVHCWVRAGDDDVALKAGASGPARHVTVADNHFYTGHGLSIGSETNGGVSDVVVNGLTLDGTVNGLRIKSDASRGGAVRNISYTDVCMRQVANPLLITPHYSAAAGSLAPDYRGIRLRRVTAVTPGRITLLGNGAAHPLQISFQDVALPGLRQLRTAADVQVQWLAANGPPLACAFPPFPGEAARPVLGVAPDGSAAFGSIQAAVDALPPDGGVIQLRPGTYRERVVVAKPGVTLLGGEDPSRFTIVADASAGTAGSTLRSATVTVSGDDFYAEGVSFANDYSRTHGLAPEGAQAVALAVTGDRAHFSRVRILGQQDTLYAGARSCASEAGPCVPARQYFAACSIAGNVDFIFGDGLAFFDHCAIHALPHPLVMVTAQSRRYAGEASGFVFDHCTLTAAAGVGHLFLGRPWRPYARVIFLHTTLDAPMDPAGWREWHPGATTRLATAYYGEYASAGAGAPRAGGAGREPWAHALTPAAAAEFSLNAFLQGSDHWNPHELPNYGSGR